ncbi:hypothetical protein HJFPF1_07693 [Paramyrothecium foliicola]|nr:hypothetical protein HJFPF1_07693 [Paramyrothecium foliicola]
MQPVPRHAGLEGHSAKKSRVHPPGKQKNRLTTFLRSWLPWSPRRQQRKDQATTAAPPNLAVPRSWLPYTPSPTDEKTPGARTDLHQPEHQKI